MRGEAVAAGAPREPEIILGTSFPAVVNDPDAARLTQPALEAVEEIAAKMLELPANHSPMYPRLPGAVSDGDPARATRRLSGTGIHGPPGQ